MAISPWLEGSVIVKAGETATGSFRGFHVLEEATISAITVTNVKTPVGALVTSLPVLSVGVPFYGEIKSITVSVGTIQLW